MSKLKFVSGKGNEGTFLAIVRPDNSGVLLSCGRINRKVVPLRIFNGTLTEVPFLPLKKVLFSKPIREFKDNLRGLIERASDSPTGSFTLDDVRTMSFGPKSEPGFSPFTPEVFKEHFFTDESHRVAVQMKNADSKEDENFIYTCRGSADLNRIVSDYNLGYKITKFDWDTSYS